ncbi:MAG: 30S ribosomal protein S16 [Bacteroidales bacterium]|jgi:small subunit ribosomal protein S16|nr:30S ribosomal protein S16 [Bacteroidales bacterium]MBR6277747.1 30S ribosomal protein S16 [Bacteroidales bacterium]
MPVKIRLARQGKKGYAHYAIVIADSRAPRDGRFVEKIGTYNPNTVPQQVDIKFDRALYWVQTGAQPTDTCRTLLSMKGVLLKDHLLRGVKKGALTEEQVEAKFSAWVKAKEEKLNAKKAAKENEKKEKAAKNLAAETKVKEAKQEALNKKKAEAEAAAKAQAEEAKAQETSEETATDEAKAE